MVLSVTLTAICSIACPGMISPPQPAATAPAKAAGERRVSPEQDTGVLVLKNGTRVAGKIRMRKDAFEIVGRAGSRTIPATDVQRWLKRADLEKELDGLRAMPNARTSFGLAQRAMWAFENGLDDRGWEMLAALYEDGAGDEIPILPRVERAAVPSLLATVEAKRTNAQKARELLLRIRKSNDGIRVARNHVTVRALGQLLRQEATTKPVARGQTRVADTKPKKQPVHDIVRRYAEDSIGSNKRAFARQALLDSHAADNQFVYRLAVRFPNGPTRAQIVDDIRAQSHEDKAADYLGAYLLKANTLGMMMRTTNVLGELASPKALPALKAMKRKIPDLMAKAKRKSTAGSGATRANVSFTTQRSYIKDFNVEVAQAAAIADPVVDVIQDGVVLDVTVAGISWTRYIYYLDAGLDKAIDKIKNGGEAER